MKAIVFALLVGLCSCDKNSAKLPSYPPPAGYKLYDTSAHQVIIASMTGINTPEIPSKVVALGWDTRFILAKQQLLTNRNHFPGDTYEIPQPGKYAFWILDTKDSVNRYGPLEEQEFAAKKKDLGVPESVNLKRVRY